MTATNPDPTSPDDASAYSHLPASQRLYRLLLAATDEQIVNAHEHTGLRSQGLYPILAELWTDIDEIADSMLFTDPDDPVAKDYRDRWKALDGFYGSPDEQNWRLRVPEARERLRLIKRLMLRAGPLSLRRRQVDSPTHYWSKEALEYQ